MDLSNFLPGQIWLAVILEWEQSMNRNSSMVVTKKCLIPLDFLFWSASGIKWDTKPNKTGTVRAENSRDQVINKE